jgi:hypothetical protein
MTNSHPLSAKNITFICALVIFCAINLQAQEAHVNVSSPMESVSYARSDQNEVLVTIKLREAKPMDAFAPISRFRITSFKITSDDRRSGMVNNAPMAADSLEYNFVIPVSTTTSGTSGALFRLSPNWKSFSFNCEYEFTADGANSSKRVTGTSFTVLRDFIEPVATKNVRATIELPVLNDGNRVTVPIKLDDDDMVIDVELFDSSNNLVASGGDFLERGNRKVIALKPDPRFVVVSGNNYQVRIKPRFRTEVDFSTKTRDWSPGAAIPSYSIVRASSSDLNNLNIVSISDPYTFRVETTNPGSMSMTIDGIPGEIASTNSTDGVIHTFEISVPTLRSLSEGSTSFRFKGTSTQGTDLTEANQSFKLNKDTQTRLLGITGLKLDTSGGGRVLQIDYQLSRKVNSQVQIDGVTLIPANFTGTDKGPYTYTAKIDINAANTLNTLQTAISKNNGGVTPVKFAITETKDRDIVEIGGFKLDAFAAPVLPQPKDKDTLLKLINDAADMVKHNKDDQALAAVKTALGLEGTTAPTTNDQQVITQVISQLKQDNGQSGKAKALAIIGSIGRVALNLFGIPVPLATPRP